MKKKLFPVVATLLLSAAALQAQGTLFNAQGQLTENGAAAPNGLYDFRFTLHQTASDAALAGPVFAPAVPVTNGLFITPIDFGLAPFANGDSRWLEISVKPAGGPTYTTLAPRQRILPTPYAIRANTAGSLSTGSTLPASQLSGTIPDVRLSSNVLLLNRSSQTISGFDTTLGIRNLNDAGGGFAGNSYSAFQLGIHNPTAQSFWNVPPNQYRSFFAIHAAGYVGSVTNVFGNPVFRNMLDDTEGNITIDNLNANAGTLRPGIIFGSHPSGEGIASRRTEGARRWGLDFYTGHALRMAIANNGNVGIGVDEPQSKLHVNGTVTAQTFVGSHVIENRASDPPSPVTGQIWLRTDVP